jgi:branched-chain amino acid aminotransferase
MSASTDGDVRVWVNGERVDGDVALTALDHGVTVGDGVFETAKVVDGEVFALRRHHDRMERSLRGLGLGPLDRHRIEQGIAAVLDGEPLTRGRLRYTVTAGPGPMGSDRLDEGMTYIVSAGPMPEVESSTAVAVVPWVRNERAATVGLKTTSYAENVIALAAAKTQGASEALFANTAGALCEGTGSNVFLVLDGVVMTPSLSCGPLAGITRALTIEWLQETGLHVVEDEIPLSLLADADEAWLTSSTRDIHPISAIRVVPSVDTLAGPLEAPAVTERSFHPAPGPVTSQAQDIFASMAAERFNP